MMPFFEGFFLNLCVLISSLFIYKQVIKEIPLNQNNFVTTILGGVLGGLLGMILMHFSIKTGANSIIDLRIIPLMLAALYGSKISSAITAGLIIVSRLMIGVNTHSFSNIAFILLSLITFYVCSQKVKNRWTSVMVMLTISNTVYTVLSMIFTAEKQVNILLLANYWAASIIGGFVAVYIMDYLTKNETLFKENKNYASTDSLTGLNNVRSFDLAFDKAKQRIKKTEEPLSLLLIDIDHFKAVNDTYGHLEGDSVLKKFAAILKTSKELDDVVSRNGGEEFTLILHNCNEERAAKKAEQLRKMIESSFFIIKNDTLAIHLTVSIGVATYDEETNRDIDHLYSHADQALYAAKQNGRNRVVAYSNISSYFLVDPLKKQGQSLRKSAVSNKEFKSRTDS